MIRYCVSWLEPLSHFLLLSAVQVTFMWLFRIIGNGAASSPRSKVYAHNRSRGREGLLLSDVLRKEGSRPSRWRLRLV